MPPSCPMIYPSSRTLPPTLGAGSRWPPPDLVVAPSALSTAYRSFPSLRPMHPPSLLRGVAGAVSVGPRMHQRVSVSANVGYPNRLPRALSTGALSIPAVSRSEPRPDFDWRRIRYVQ